MSHPLMIIDALSLQKYYFFFLLMREKDDLLSASCVSYQNFHRSCTSTSVFDERPMRCSPEPMAERLK